MTGECRTGVHGGGCRAPLIVRGREEGERWDHRQAVALFIFVMTTCPFRHVTVPAGYVQVIFSSSPVVTS